MKGKENSMPEKKSMKMKWVKLRRRYEFVRVGIVGGVEDFSAEPLAEPLVVGLAREDGNVSGR